MEHLKIILLVTSFVLPSVMALSIALNCKRSCSKVMVLAMVNVSAMFLFNYLYFQHEFLAYSYIHSLHIGTVLWIFPSIYIYVKSVINHKVELSTLFHLIPGITFMLISGVLMFCYLDPDQRIFYLSNYRNGDIHFTSKVLKIYATFRYIDVALIFMQVIYYSIAITRQISLYHNEIAQEYSDLKEYSLVWINRLVYLFLVVGLLFILFYIFNPYSEQNSFLLVMVMFFSSVFMWLMGLISIRQRTTPSEISISESVTSIESTSNYEENSLLMALEKYILRKKPYLKADITLTELSREIGTNRSYLSSLINKHYGVNFNVYINMLRAEYAITLQKEQPNLSKADICTQSGFGSTATMKRALENLKLN